jgi:predicted metal-dependent HD superfamily phosphohydrolase
MSFSGARNQGMLHGLTHWDQSMAFAHTLGGTRHVFADLRTLLARATPFRSGDALAGVAAASAAERVAAQMALADTPLASVVDEPVIPYDDDEVTRLILDGHDRIGFAPFAAMTVGAFREFLLAAEPAEYEAYAAAIRREYSVYPDLLYRRGRASVLAKLLAMPPLYRTPALKAQWEKRARENLARELAGL